MTSNTASASITRYDPDTTESLGNPCMSSHPTGDWCKFSDVKPIIDQLENHIELYEAMKSGFTTRASDYEKRIAELEAKLSWIKNG